MPQACSPTVDLGDEAVHVSVFGVTSGVRMRVEGVTCDTGDETIRNHAASIWSVAHLLRGDNKQSEYGRVILPMVVLRRLDWVLDPPRRQPDQVSSVDLAATPAATVMATGTTAMAAAELSAG